LQAPFDIETIVELEVLIEIETLEGTALLKKDPPV
jgi:hypothetical protein